MVWVSDNRFEVLYMCIVISFVGFDELNNFCVKLAQRILKCKYVNTDFKQKYQIKSNHTATEKRKGNKIWFNPPYSTNIVTKVGKHSLSLFDEHFTQPNNFQKVFNRNTVKISYSCIPNMKTIINLHNLQLLR